MRISVFSQWRNAVRKQELLHRETLHRGNHECKQRHLMSLFLGIANRFHDHIADHSSIAVVPLQKMVRDYEKSKSLVWMPKSERGIIRESEYSIADCQTDPLVDGH
jgi:hypothetical protein